MLLHTCSSEGHVDNENKMETYIMFRELGSPAFSSINNVLLENA
jgi:hypothetical protein